MADDVTRNEVEWTPHQDAKIWFWDKSTFAEVRIIDELQMVQLLDMYKAKMHCQLIVEVFDKKLCDAVNELEPQCIEPSGEPNTDFHCADVTELATDEQSNALIITKTGIFDNEEDYVGVNDEYIYIPIPTTNPPAASHAPDFDDNDDNDEHVAAEGCITFEAEIKRLPAGHNCATTKLKEGKMASQGWCADRLLDWVKKNPQKGASEAKDKLEDDYGIKLKYSKALSGLKQAVEQVHGKYDEIFQLLFNWKAQIDIFCPGSVVQIDVTKKTKRFRRIFVALKPCIDGFLAGCRPYLGVDATSLHGQYTGQLAAATGVDGHNWLFNVAFAVFDSETENNWKWFMGQLRMAIGAPTGLVICTDACKGLEIAVGAYYTCDVFTEHLYLAARSYTDGLFNWHMKKIYEFAPDALDYLDTYHNRIWYRCAFSKKSKCDYLTNNVSESFNSQIKKLKGLLLHELVDGIREMIMEKRYLRKKIGRLMQDGILPNVIKELNTISKNLRVVKVSRSDDDIAEVTFVDQWNNIRRHSVDLQNRKCSCREWQLTGKPCKHALAWICSNRGIENFDFVHEYYSVARFRVAYEGRLEPIPDRTQWPAMDLGFKVLPLLLKRSARRPKTQRIRGCLKKNASKKKIRCKRCGGFGHFSKICKFAQMAEGRDNMMMMRPSQAKKKKALAKKKKKTPKKNKTPAKKKQKQAAAAPPPSVR
ncbi:hypothetical protein U9M48_022651 [Paspalum notatum var. saurae]|uniref:SWIM-type domain-containing protein n=1 Tax=Paspalum notatum var. saurae TaxID=547442 RepID=A0AAQ3WU73_PASNO